MATDYTPIGPVPSGIANGTVDATSRQLAQDMRGKAYGKDVRETMARMIEWTSIRTQVSENALLKIEDFMTIENESWVI